MNVVALVTDLIFATKIKSTADATGVPVSVVRSLDALRQAAGDTGGARLAIIDLGAAGVDTIEAIRAVKATALATRAIAYASHVETALMQQASDAGADLVLPRSKFSADLPELLRKYSQPRNS